MAGRHRLYTRGGGWSSVSIHQRQDPHATAPKPISKLVVDPCTAKSTPCLEEPPIREGYFNSIRIFRYRPLPLLTARWTSPFCRHATSPGFMPRLTCSPPSSSATNPPSDSSTTIT